jgi:plastocyanin
MATTAVKTDFGRGAALGAAAIAQAILGLEFLLGGLNKYLDSNFTSGFRSFVAASAGAQDTVLSPLVQNLILPNAAVFAELARFTELACGLILVVATASLFRGGFGVRTDAAARSERVVALLALVAAIALGGLSLTIYLLKGGGLPGVDPRLALAPPVPVELVNVLLAGSVVWLQAGRLLGLRSNAMSVVAVSALVAILLGVSACGGTAAAGPPSGAIQVTMTEYAFKPSNLQLKTGTATFYLVNSGSQQHDMVIADAGGKVMARSELVYAGNTATFTVSNLPAGTYTIYCDVPGHRESGMSGKLTVEGGTG